LIIGCAAIAIDINENYILVSTFYIISIPSVQNRSGGGVANPWVIWCAGGLAILGVILSGKGRNCAKKT
jgi:hypothetical protein